MHADAVDVCLSKLLADDLDARAALTTYRQAARDSGDAVLLWLLSAAELLTIAADFDDFRGLDAALAQFSVGCASAPRLARERDELRVAAARVVLPSLDHAVAHDDPQVLAAAARLHAALRDGSDLPAGERVLMAKVLIDHAAMLNDAQAVGRVVAIMQPEVQSGTLSRAWQGRWWLLLASNADYFGQPEAALEARARAEALTEQGGLPALRFELLCDEMSRALRADDGPRAERIYVRIEHLRPEVAPGRVTKGLRAQAAMHTWRGEYRHALARIELLLALCEDLQVPLRDRGSYFVQRAYCLIGLREHAGAVAQLQALQPLQKGGQGEVLSALLELAHAVRGLDEGVATARALVASALRRCETLDFNRFLMPLPQWASRLAEIALEDGVATEFVTAAVRARRLRPTDPTREDWPWRLQIQALGPLRLRRDGAPLRFTGKVPKKPLELLALLVAHGGRPLPLDVAQSALWSAPEAGDPKAALEAALSRLRKLLDVPDAVLIGDGGLQLDARLAWTDVAAFETLEQRWRAAIAPGAESAEAAALARRAIALYGGALLGNETQSPAGRVLREGLGRRFAALVTGYGRTLETAGHWREAAELYEQALSRDMVAEPLYRALMRVQLQLGERAEAMRTFVRCRDMLAMVLGVAPSHDTLVLREQAAGHG